MESMQASLETEQRNKGETLRYALYYGSYSISYMFVKVDVGRF